MTAVQEKMEKANQAIMKKYDLIGKRYAQAEKQVAQINALGIYQFEYIEDYKALKQQCIDYDSARIAHCKGMTEEQFYSDANKVWVHDSYWMVAKLEDIVESIENAYKAIEEKKDTIARYKEQIAKADQAQQEFEALPDIIKQFSAQVADMWDAWDLMRQASVIQAQQDVVGLTGDEYQEIRSRYSESEWYELPVKTKEQIHAENDRSAKALALNLACRVQYIVGDIEDASDLRLTAGNGGCVVINGIVKGATKSARVQSVGAGGWNIQRYHIRTLVHEVKGVA